jgi:hypothetical protein
MKLLFRLALILAGSAAIAAGLSAQTPGGMAGAPPAPDALSINSLGPRMRFNTEVHDAGTNLAGDSFRYTFIITNTGDETLVLSNVIPGCSCVAVSESPPPALTLGAGPAAGSTNTWTREIPPGQTGVIPVQVFTSTLHGAINRTVTVISNDRTRPNVTVHITGEVLQPIEVVPAMAVFNLAADATSNNTQVLKIFNQTKTPLTLFDPQCTTNAFSAVLKTNVAGQEYELTVTVAPASSLPPAFGNTSIQGGISLKSSFTNLSGMNPLQIGVLVTIYPEVTVSPANILLPGGPLPQATTNHIVIRGNTANLTLSGPGANVPGVEVSLNVIQPNRQYYLSVVFPKGFEIQPGQSVLLTVKSNHPRFPVLSVPVMPMFSARRGLPPAVPPPMRTTILPASILARVQPNPSNAPAAAPDPPPRQNPPHP